MIIPSSDSEMSDVVLIFMPFAPLNSPSLALGCLSGALRQAGISVRSLYFNLDFGETLGLKSYLNLSHSLHYGEWIFSHAAFPDMKRDDEEIFQMYPPPLPRKILLKLRDDADSFIDKCVQQVLALNPKIVGCSSTFFQSCASLALLRRIRETAPEITTVMGGANCEGVMGGELHRSFSWVDYVFSGEADESFPDFCRALLAGEKIGGDGGWNRPDVLTIYDRCQGGAQRELGRGTIATLSNLPVPFVDDYYEALNKSNLRNIMVSGLLLETSRGCWIGAKKTCAFCGLNGLSKKYRSKDSDKAYHEITLLTERHGITSIQMTDNLIDLAHIEQLLPRFEGKIFFMYEVLATLSRERMRKLSESGVRRMQSGIEQLHDKALVALGKQNKTFHNIRFLKWAREYGIDVVWNLLYAFPGEKDDWYGETADIIPLLTHLQPPTDAVMTRFYRFSPYFNEQERYGLTLKPMRSYHHAFPLDEESLSRIAYYFECDDALADTRKLPKPGLARLFYELLEWKKLFPPIFAKGKDKSPVLAMTQTASNTLIIEDTRPVATSPYFSFYDVEAAVYVAADQGRTVEEIFLALSKHDFPGLLASDVENIVQDFVEARLMINLDGRYLALAAVAPFRDYLSEEQTPGGWYRKRSNIENKKKEIIEK